MPHRIIDFVGHPIRAAYMVLALAFILAGSLGYTVYQVSDTHHRFATIIHRNCKDIQSLKSYAYQTILRGEKTLPTLTYYKQHPDELAKQLALSREDAKFFKPKSCP